MLNVLQYHQPKIGNSEREYEDAFAFNIDKGLFAMADGSSESVFSNLWAKSLVDTFVTGNYGMRLDEMVETALGLWRSKLPWDSMKWFVRNKVARGSMSTFLGVEMHGSAFNAVAVGDTCLFLVTPSSLHSFPIKSPSEFGNTPKLVWTGNPLIRTRRSIKWAVFYEGKMSEKDLMIMATDSLAYWLLKNHASRPWDQLIEHMDNEGDFINSLINRGEMKNDDVTFAIISLKQP